MGCAPSAELLNEAPFRPPQGGVRQVALIPIVEQYFPTPDCALFRQLYEAYTDPSVRYYVRPDFEGANGDLSRIPDVVNSRAELHALLLQLTGQGMFATNADVRAAYARGEGYRIRPILCAVVFLYEGANYVPEGSVQLPMRGRGPSAFVKVIGVVGDTSKMLRKAGDPATSFSSDDTLKMQTLITKSAGDHNMSRVVLLASYIYCHQCCEVIGLSKVPSMAAYFTCFKTNIPFLCFLREMRDRTAAVLESPKDSKFYIDEYCLHGAVTKEYMDVMVPAFAYYFVSFLNAKSEQRMAKQLAHHHRANGMVKDSSQGSNNASYSALSTCNSSNMNGEVVRRPETIKESDQLDREKISQVAAWAARADVAASGSNNPTPKVTYIVKGYLTRPATTLSAWSCAPNEVYVTCMNGTVTVVDRRSVDASDGPTHTPSLGQADGVEEIEEERGMPASAHAIVETFAVRRGDILSFYSPSSHLAENAAAAELAENGGYTDDHSDSESFTSSNVNILRLNTDDDDDSIMPSPSVESLVKNETESSVQPRQGSWRIDDSIFIESVLLSLVRDECKLAREASVDDPRWVHDDARNCPVHDGSFYVWHFRRGQENFFYGTVPKFANTNRTQGRGGGGASGTRALRSNGARANQNGMLLEQSHAGVRGGTNVNGDSIKKPDLINGAGAGRQPIHGVAMPQQQRIGLPVVYSTNGSLTDVVDRHPQLQLQQRQHQPLLPPPPSYVASASVKTSAPVGNTLPGSGPVYVMQNGSVATAASPPGQLVYNVPYALPGQPPQFSTPPGAYVVAQPSQHQQQTRGSTWMQMCGPAPAGRVLGDTTSGASFSVSSNVPSTASAPNAVPYVMNAQGQLVPLSNVMMDKGQQSVMRVAASTSPAPTAAQGASYVMVNGQLCLIQPATAAPLSPQYHMAAQQAQQQQQFMNNVVYLQR